VRRKQCSEIIIIHYQRFWCFIHQGGNYKKRPTKTATPTTANKLDPTLPASLAAFSASVILLLPATVVFPGMHITLVSDHSGLPVSYEKLEPLVVSFSQAATKIGCGNLIAASYAVKLSFPVSLEWLQEKKPPLVAFESPGLA
jgi:hypothetical protein